ncbi:NF038104 family lipoprotein [Acinetobacter larvae]|uniref:NF038104 family lipoprotein n=1 Tax=Acinetobacter larvae TaxID=1789224 RepID=A0A1B2M4C3_9GAMM|nr:NF038104 family lipoprotein [Acinetobacter larvae]AOA59991.1 hypothetical protein BFG52_12180 [Acinetobacter larvae]
MNVKILLFVSCLSLFCSGCITKVVTVPVKVAYKTTKGVVKGTGKVVGAMIPDGEDDDDKHKDDKHK